MNGSGTSAIVSGKRGLRFRLTAVGLLLVPALAGGQTDGEANGSGGDFIPPEAHVCLGCHTIDEGRRQGADAAPPLRGVVGRAPRVEGVALERWDQAALDRWLANPRAMAPETASRFPGYADAASREAVIRFLRQLQ